MTANVAPQTADKLVGSMDAPELRNMLAKLNNRPLNTAEETLRAAVVRRLEFFQQEAYMVARGGF